MNSATEYVTTKTFLIAVGVLSVIIASIYFYVEYRRITQSKMSKEHQDSLVNDCPDYWETVSKDSKTGIVTCRNSHLLGRCANRPDTSTYTFSDPIFVNSSTGRRAKETWAHQCGVSWKV